MEKEKVLLLRLDKAGDAVKTLPVIDTIKNLSQFEFSFLCSAENYSLFENDNRMRFLKFSPEDPIIINEEYDRIINLQCDPHGFTLNLLSSFRSPKIYSCHFKKKDERMIQVDIPGPVRRDESLNIKDIIENSLGCEIPYPSSEEGKIFLTPKEEGEAKSFFSKLPNDMVGVCPFAGLKNRSHSLDKWCEFIRVIATNEKVGGVVFFGAPQDYDEIETMMKKLDRDNVFFTKTSSFRSLAAFFPYLKGVVAVDSGPSHLARYLGIPSFIVMSGGDQHRWFSNLKKNDVVLRRGLLSRYPSLWKMKASFKSWVKGL